MKITIEDISKDDFAKFDKSFHDGRLVDILGHSFVVVEIHSYSEAMTAKLVEVKPVTLGREK